MAGSFVAVLPFRSSTRKRRIANVLAPYMRPTWYHRHRKLCLTVLGFICFVYGMAWGLFGQFVLPMLLLPLVPAVGLLLWLLPETGHANERLLVQGLFAYLLVLLCWPDYLALALPGLPWLTLLRVVGFPLVLVFLVSLSVSRDYRALGKDILHESPVLWRCVVAFSLIGAISIAFSTQPFFSLQKYIIAQVNWTAIFFLSCYVFTVRGTVDRLAMTLWGVTVFVCIIGIWEGRLGRLPWLGHIPSFLAIQDESVQKVLDTTMRAGTNRYRVQSKFSTALGLGEFLALSTPFILHFAVKGRTKVVQLAAVATIPIIGWTIYLTDSRLAAIGMFISLALYILFHGMVRLTRGRNDLLGSAIVFGYPAVFSMMLAATFLIGRLRARIWGDGSQQASNDARQSMYETGIPMVLRHPWGHGFGMGGYTLGFTTPNGTLTIDTYYLAVALEFGIVGFFVFYGMYLFAMWQASRNVLKNTSGELAWLGPTAIALFSFVLIKSVFAGMENHPLAFALLGLVVALTYRAKRIEPARTPPRQQLSGTIARRRGQGPALSPSRLD